MRKVVMPLEMFAQRSAQLAIQPSSLPLIPLNQEGSLVQLVEPEPERPEPEMTPVLVEQLETVPAVVESDIAPQSTLMPQPTTAAASQEFPATLVTAQTLLLLTSTLIYDRIVTPAAFEPQ